MSQRSGQAITLGLDIGSRSVDAVWLDADGAVQDSQVAESGFDPLAVARGFLKYRHYDAVVATGYGRHSAALAFGADAVTEIKAYALGARHLFSQARGVLDIGGQDTKAISLGSDGRVLRFEMNDKCAAGTGKFLEVMAHALGYELDELGQAAATAEDSVAISSMCAVFAESEVVGLLHRGFARQTIAAGVHSAIIKRTLGTLARMQIEGPLVFAGGVARNVAAVKLLREQFGGEVLVPDATQTVGALGAALVARSATA